jgi:hypothetical protein
MPANGAAAAPFKGSMSILQTRLDILDRQLRVGAEEVVEIRVVGEVFDDSLHRNPRPSDDGLARHNGWVLHYAVVMVWCFLLHDRGLSL